MMLLGWIRAGEKALSVISSSPFSSSPASASAAPQPPPLPPAEERRVKKRQGLSCLGLTGRQPPAQAPRQAGSRSGTRLGGPSQAAVCFPLPPWQEGERKKE